jgi:hypothetical protein
MNLQLRLEIPAQVMLIWPETNEKVLALPASQSSQHCQHPAPFAGS